MKKMHAIGYDILTVLILVAISSQACQSDVMSGGGEEQIARLINAEDARECEYFIFSRTKEEKGFRPVDMDNSRNLPRALTHRLVPLVEEWETEVCYTRDGHRALERRRIGDAAAANPTALGYAPSPTSRTKIDQEGTIDNYAGEEWLSGSAPGRITDKGAFEALSTYRRLPKDSFLLAMRALRDSLAVRESDIEIRLAEDYVTFTCNTPGFVGVQMVDAETQLPRVAYSTNEAGEMTQTLFQSHHDDGDRFPRLIKTETRQYVDPTTTGGVPMYSFERKTYLEHRITSLD